MNINLDEFKKLDVRIGRIVFAEKVENADKLFRLEVDLGSEVGKRQIVAGIAQWYKSEDLVGKKCPFLVNLEPKTFRGVESQGMLLAVGVEDSAVLLHPDKEVLEGSIIR